MGLDGKKYVAQEADRVFTDADFKVTRIEAVVDQKQWMGIAAYANGRDPATFTSKDYYEAMSKMQ